ncbi:amidohydrolase family protein [Litoribacter alkaliphilus]|uniref:Amidohydrolase family protein n=1 Tax=Litoribacter ruber TaxID=702568 RepID=A0AAP2G690_9BACT|nr:amidohydrolase family protein [Litoribacter alkaliphilus]MBS9525443.1 amidohydrolase family protein [Litoribacter alkaliphilus]
MRQLLLIILLLPFTSPAQSFLVKNVNIVTLSAENPILSNQSILVENGKIQSIGSNLEVEADSIIEGAGKYVLPGLAEMHSHIPNAENGDFSFLEDVMWLYLANGVTTIRGMIGHPSHLELKERIKSGQMMGPRIFAAGPSLNGNSVESPQHGRQLVHEQAEAGYDHLKIHPGLSMEKFIAIAETAKEKNIMIGGHVPLDVGLENVILNGFHSVEHLDGYLEAMLPHEDYKNSEKAGPFSMNFSQDADLSKLPELVKLTRENNVAVAPTMTLFEHFFGYLPASELKERAEIKYLPKDQIVKWAEQKQRLEDDGILAEEKVKPFLSLRDQILMELYEADVLILLSSDSPQVFNVPGFATHREIKSMKNAGMKAVDILKSGSKNVAQYFNQDTFGEIVVGKDADFLIVRDNPLEKLETLEELEGLFVGGNYIDRERIQSELDRIEEKNK